MIDTGETYVVTADWLVPVDTAPIPHGHVVLEQGIIRFVGEVLPQKFQSVQCVQLSGFAILPGLINSHCHLEFSDLAVPIAAGDSFPDWIRSLLAFRRAKNIDPEQMAMDRQAAIASGIRESYQTGVRWVVDMATEPWSIDWIANAIASISAASLGGTAPKVPICVQPCIELLDIVEHRIDTTFALVRKHIDAPKSIGLGRIGFAPHAPYTASRNVTQWCAALPRNEHRLVTMHLAESKAELQWLHHRNGPFAELLGPIIGSTYFERMEIGRAHV